MHGGQGTQHSDPREQLPLGTRPGAAGSPAGPAVPAVSPYIAEAVRRCALPIRVNTGKDIHGYFIAIQDARIRTVPLALIVGLWNAGWPHLTSSPRDATRAYLSLVASLSAPDASLSMARNSAAGVP